MDCFDDSDYLLLANQSLSLQIDSPNKKARLTCSGLRSEYQNNFLIFALLLSTIEKYEPQEFTTKASKSIIIIPVRFTLKFLFCRSIL